MSETLTVTQISQKIKDAVNGNPELTSIWIKGEISNITYHSSGHIYFTLKDSNSVLNAAFFKNANRSCNFKMKEGMSIIAFGSITIYERRGSYQMIVNSVTQDGIGNLQKQIEELKKKLSSEGIFNQQRKQPIPFLPKKIGVVTSPTGAAFRDILKVALRRFPNVEILLAPAKVQGEDAAPTIVAGIKALNNPEWDVDVIIAGRGGGSFEDLMPFNEESVIRAFAESKIPIISAVGHQIDHPLSDEAADCFAPTPSAAAEIALPVKNDIYEKILSLESQSLSSIQKRIEEGKYRIENISDRRVFKNPFEMIYMREISLEDCTNRLSYAMRDTISNSKNRLMEVKDIDNIFNNYYQNTKYTFSSLVKSLHQLSPLNVISRGFSAAFDSKKNIIKSVDKINSGENIDIYVSDGSINCSVNSIQKGDTIGKD